MSVVALMKAYGNVNTSIRVAWRDGEIGRAAQMKWFTLMLLRSVCVAQTVTVNWDTVNQTMDEFGAASAGDIPTLGSTEMDFFYTQAGIKTLVTFG